MLRSMHKGTQVSIVISNSEMKVPSKTHYRAQLASKTGGHLLTADTLRSICDTSHLTVTGFKGTASNPPCFKDAAPNPAAFKDTASKPAAFKDAAPNPAAFEGTASNPTGFKDTASNPACCKDTTSNPAVFKYYW